VGAAALPAGAGEHGSDGLLQALVIIGDDQADAAQATGHEVAQEGGPAGTVLARDHVTTQDFAVTICIDTDRGEGGDVHDAPTLAATLGLGVDPEVGVGSAVELSGAEGIDQLVKLRGHLGDPRLGQPVDAQRLHKTFNAAYGDAAQVGLSNHLHDRFLGAAPGLEQPVREVRALAELGNLQRDRAQPGVPARSR
jgi:hypothetical protein